MPELSWTDGPYALIARVVGVPFGLWIASKEIYDGTYDVLAMHPTLGYPVVAGTSAIPTTHPHFPYGAVVFPD